MSSVVSLQLVSITSVPNRKRVSHPPTQGLLRRLAPFCCCSARVRRPLRTTPDISCDRGPPPVALLPVLLPLLPPLPLPAPPLVSGSRARRLWGGACCGGWCVLCKGSTDPPRLPRGSGSAGRHCCGGACCPACKGMGAVQVLACGTRPGAQQVQCEASRQTQSADRPPAGGSPRSESGAGHPAALPPLATAARLPHRPPSCSIHRRRPPPPPAARPPRPPADAPAAAARSVQPSRRPPAACCCCCRCCYQPRCAAAASLSADLLRRGCLGTPGWRRRLREHMQPRHPRHAGPGAAAPPGTCCAAWPAPCSETSNL